MAKSNAARPKPSADIVFFAGILFYIAVIALLKPWSLDFNQNDDWAYALGVQHLIQDHRLRLCDWTAVTQVLQIAWGALWVKVFGWHLGILKLSTLACAALGAIFFNSSLKVFHIPQGIRFLAVFVLIVNPFYFSLGFSFMTEVPYLSLVIMACAFYLKSEQFNSNAYLLAGSLAAAGAYLVRQTGAAIPLGYFLYLAAYRRLTFKKTILLWGPVALAVLGYSAWFKWVHGPTWASENTALARSLLFFTGPGFPRKTFFNLYVSLFLLGASLMPFTVGVLSSPRQFFKKKSAVSIHWITGLLLLLYAIGCIVFLSAYGKMPHLASIANALQHTGLGVMTVAEKGYKAAGIFGWSGLWVAMTVAAAAGGAAALTAAGDSVMTTHPLEKAGLHIFLTSAAAQFIIVLLRTDFFDRYILLILPAAILVMALCSSRWNVSKPIAYAGLGGLFLFSWLGTSDHLAWNQARWRAAELGVRRGIPPGDISNGFDWGGYWTYERNLEAIKKIKPLKGMGDWEWQTLNRTAALTSFNANHPEFVLLEKVPYRTPLSRQTQYIYLWTR